MNKGLDVLKRIENQFNQLGIKYKESGCHIREDDYFVIEKELKALNTISQNFKLVGNCLHAKNKYAESGWVFVKELEDEEEHNAWKEVLL